jgi:hypothetical protein
MSQALALDECAIGTITLTALALTFACLLVEDYQSVPCQYEDSPWSPCSVSCGMGQSSRVTNRNDVCQPVQVKLREMMLVYVWMVCM